MLSPPSPGAKATSDSVATQDAGPGLAIGLALGGCLLVALLGAAAVFVWHRKRRMQPPPSSASTAAPQEVEVIVARRNLSKCVGGSSCPFRVFPPSDRAARGRRRH